MVDKYSPTISHEEVEKNVDIALYGKVIGQIVSLFRKITTRLLQK
jgi:hypothetical protein